MNRGLSDWPFRGWPALNGMIQALLFFVITVPILFIVVGGAARMTDGLPFWRWW